MIAPNGQHERALLAAVVEVAPLGAASGVPSPLHLVIHLDQMEKK